VLRLRQAVVVARDLDVVAGDLRAALGLGAPFHDEAVGVFGLRNAVMALGDTFVEVVSPVREDTAAGRQLDRLGGDGGYMAMFQVGDLAAARERIAAAGVRVVFDYVLPDIADVHLHPRDVPGAIVALDQCTPPEGWRWGGPAWEGRAPAFDAAAGVRGLTLRSRDPETAAARWAAVLGRDADGAAIALDGGEVRVVAGDDERIEAFHVAGLAEPVVLAGVRFEPASA
jgi:hypothetical protein